MTIRFTAAQVAALRARLAQYRDDFKLRDTHPLSIEGVLAEMEECVDVPRAFFAGYEGKTGYERKALNNRLSRFVNGGTPEPTTCEALDRFLSYVEALPASEGGRYDPDADARASEDEALTVHGLMANGSPAARKAFETLRDGEYTARRFQDDPWRVSLHFTCDTARMIVRIEEHTVTPDIRMNSGQPPRERGTATCIRIGYGFLATPRCGLHVFLVGAHARDRVHYVQLDTIDPDGHPYLLRVGGETGPVDERVAAWAKTLPAPESVDPYIHGVLRFRSVALEQESARLMATPAPPPSPDMRFHRQGDDETPSLAEQRQATQAALIEAIRTNSAGLTRDAVFYRGADVRAQDDEGMTALHHAAALDARSAIRVLVGSGKCDYLIRDNKGRYADDLALVWGRDCGVARLLMRKRLQQAVAQGRPSREHRQQWCNPPRGRTPLP